jgi:hypothetical protein
MLFTYLDNRGRRNRQFCRFGRLAFGREDRYDLLLRQSCECIRGGGIGVVSTSSCFLVSNFGLFGSGR